MEGKDDEFRSATHSVSGCPVRGHVLEALTWDRMAFALNVFPWGVNNGSSRIFRVRGQ